MHSFKTIVVALLSASTAFAYQGLYARSPDPSLDLEAHSSLLKREAYAAAYAHAYADAYSDTYVDLFTRDSDLFAREIELLERDAAADIPEGLYARDQKKEVLAYLQNINTRNVGGSFGEGQWNRLHGDTKSGSGGTWHTELMHKSGKYSARVVGPGGKSYVETDVPVQAGQKPWAGCAVHFLRVKLGGAKGSCSK